MTKRSLIPELRVRLSPLPLDWQASSEPKSTTSRTGDPPVNSQTNGDAPVYPRLSLIAANGTPVREELVLEFGIGVESADALDVIVLPSGWEQELATEDKYAQFTYTMDGTIFRVNENIAITYYYVDSEGPSLNTTDHEPLEVIDLGMAYDALEATENTVDELDAGRLPMTVPPSVHQQQPQAVLNYSVRPSASAISAAKQKASKPDVGRPSASTISTVELTATKQDRGRPSVSAISASRDEGGQSGYLKQLYPADLFAAGGNSTSHAYIRSAP